MNNPCFSVLADEACEATVGGWGCGLPPVDPCTPKPPVQGCHPIVALPILCLPKISVGWQCCSSGIW